MDQIPTLDAIPELPTDTQEFPMEGPPPAIDPRLSADGGKALERLTVDLQRDIETAFASRNDLNDRVKRYRAYYGVDQLPAAYEGQPNHRVPYIRGKVDGASAHFRGALDQDPFFVTRPYTEEAAKNQGPWEATMERELDRSGSRAEILAAVDEACLVPVAPLQLSVVYDDNGEATVQARAIRFEDFWVSPVGVTDLSRVSTYYRFVEPWHIVREKFDRGEYDEEAFDRLKRDPGIQHRPNYDEEVDNTQQHAYQDDNTVRELYECYYRWGNDDIGYHLWRIIYHEQQNLVLRAEINPYEEAFDVPPYPVLRTKPKIDYFYGECYPQVLEGVQNIMDFAYNSYLAYMQSSITPITFVDQDSELWQVMKDLQIAPGATIPVRGDPRQSVMPYVPPPAQNPLELMQVARALGEDATFSDLLMQGIPTNKVRSATEINAVLTAGTKHLARDLSNLAHGLSELARMYWALIYHFKIKDKGVMPVFEGSDQYLIASEELSEDDILQHLVDFLQIRTGIQLGAMAGEAKALLRQVMEAQGVELFISSGARDDMEWAPNGGTLIPEKAMRANKLERLIAAFLPVWQIARQFRGPWNLFRKYLESLDIHDWESYLPPQPPEQEDIPPDQMQMFAQSMNLLRQGGGSGG